MAPPHTHPSTPSHGSTPPVFRQKLKLANAALEKEAAELQHSIAKQDAQIAELAREMERLDKLKQSGALVFPATATSEELIITEPKIIKMLKDHMKKALEERKLGKEDVVYREKLSSAKR